MPLSINPIAQLVASVSQSITQAANDAQAALPTATSLLAKANLDKKISLFAGELGSGLNGITGNLKNLGGTGMGGLASAAQSNISGAINSLQSAVASTSNIASDISGSLNKLTGGNLAGGLMGLAGSVSSAAGMLNNVLSQMRGANIPAGADLFLKQGQAIKLHASNANDWRVRINCDWKNFKGNQMFQLLSSTSGVVWPYLPSITVSTKAEYNAISPVHSNYPIQSYKSSTVEDIQISGEFTCETESDAAYWIAATTFFKTATKMFFGQGEFSGNPPIVCNLTGYGASIFDNVPIVVKSFSVDLKEDVNYVNCNTFGTNTWVPIVSTISVTVSPIYNRQRLRQFNLQDYSKGKMAGSGVGEISGVGYI